MFGLSQGLVIKSLIIILWFEHKTLKLHIFICVFIVSQDAMSTQFHHYRKQRSEHASNMKLLMFKFRGYRARWHGREGCFTVYEQTKAADFSFLCSICCSEPWQEGTAVVFQMECEKLHINKSTQLVKVLSCGTTHNTWAVKQSP